MSSRADPLPLARSLDEAPMTKLRVRFWLLAGLGIMLDGFDFFIIGVANPLIAEDFDVSAATKGLISAAAIVGAIVGAWRTVFTAVPWFLMDIATYGVGIFTPTLLAAMALRAPTRPSSPMTSRRPRGPPCSMCSWSSVSRSRSSRWTASAGSPCRSPALR